MTHSGVRFTWDATKNAANQVKHGVSFEEAVELFNSGAPYFEAYDDVHSGLEDRFIAIGPIARGMVFIVWTERSESELRVISARSASKRECQRYVRFMEDRR